MKYLEAYLDSVKNELLVKSISSTVKSMDEEFISLFDYKSHKASLLLGHVQSGKTAQLLGLISHLADKNFKLFVVLTSSINALQKQTFKRIRLSLKGFTVCDETDTVQFLSNKLKKPLVIVLKKNSKVLESWRNHIASSGYAKKQTVIIIDDEADASSLNTLINKNQVSTINYKIDELRKLSSSSIYFQVTATPQSIFLQSSESDWRPEYIHYFSPGKGYLGGDFFYSTPRPYCVKFSKENELDALLEGKPAEGFLKSICTFLLISSYFIQKDHDENCNFLIHPSVKIKEHKTIHKLASETVNDIIEHPERYRAIMQGIWDDLKSSKPDLFDLDNLIEQFEKLTIGYVVMNSENDYNDNYENGFNIIIGGNSLGRGVTFPSLNVVYYCRASKKPQADTYWQHCRMFGYDRNMGLIRIYLPESLYEMFSDLNKANNIIISQLNDLSINIGLVYPDKISPTRKNVYLKSDMLLIIGDTNYFPNNPDEYLNDYIYEYLEDYADGQHSVDIQLGIDILENYRTKDAGIWATSVFADALKALRKEYKTMVLVKRSNRDIAKGTGTLLSPSDRKIGTDNSDQIVLTIYEINGNTDKGWSGKKFWIPNIKLPKNKNFYQME